MEKGRSEGKPTRLVNDSSTTSLPIEQGISSVNQVAGNSGFRDDPSPSLSKRPPITKPPRKAPVTKTLDHGPKFGKVLSLDVIPGLHPTVAAIKQKLPPFPFDKHHEDAYKGLPHLGPYMSKSGKTYQGQWKGGEKHGCGTMITKSGACWEGYWNHDFFDGYGRQIFTNGDVYEGEIICQGPAGKGVFTLACGDKYVGDFSNYEMIHGLGECFYANGDVYTGMFHYGKIQGEGILKDKNGVVVEQGTWHDGKFVE